LASTGFFSSEDVYFNILIKNVIPFFAIPSGLAMVGLFGHYQQKSLGIQAALLDTEEQATIESDPSSDSLGSAILTSFILSGLTFGIKFGTQFVIRWIASNIFDQSDDNSELYSVYASNIAGAATALGFTNSLLKRIR